MRYGIPEYRLPYDQIDKDVNYILSLGVKIHYNKTVGKDITLEKLSEDYDAVFAGTGLHLGRSTRVEGTDHEHVYQSIELLFFELRPVRFPGAGWSTGHVFVNFPFYRWPTLSIIS